MSIPDIFKIEQFTYQRTIHSLVANCSDLGLNKELMPIRITVIGKTKKVNFLRSQSDSLPTGDAYWPEGSETFSNGIFNKLLLVVEKT